MKLYTSSIATALAVGIVASSLSNARAAKPPPIQYKVVDLGADGIGNGITDSGRVVGSKNFGGPAGTRHAAFWPGIVGQPIDLGALPGAVNSRGFGINPSGQMVGSGSGQPLFWASAQTAPVVLPGLLAGAEGIASSINPSGQIVGVIGDDAGAHPVSWPNHNTPATPLPVSPQFPNGQAFSINPAGNIFGDACDADFVECHCAFWFNSASAPVILPSPNGEFIYTDVGFSSGFAVAPALNNGGSMVGFAVNADGSATRAVYWAKSASPALILNGSPEFSNGTAEGINEQGQIVGTAFNADFSADHAFFWPSPTSAGIDLNTVIPAGSGWELAVARSINNRGEITVGGVLNGTQHTAVLVPVHGRSTSDMQ
jgi:probable HAF family extracellular repeat protein